MSDQLNSAKSAINAISQCRGVDPAQTRQANQWLIDFESSQAAWEVADQLLVENINSPFRFFGAKIFYSKLKRNFNQLDNPQLVESVKMILVNHLLKLSIENPIDMKVCKYLCLCLAVLSIQLNRPGIINEILGWLNSIISVAPRVVLQLLIYIPEESSNRQIVISLDTREQFTNQLTESAPHVFSFLAFLWENGELDQKIQILKCLENWISSTNVTFNSVFTLPLFHRALDCLKGDSDVYLENVVDLLVKVVGRFTSESIDVAHALVPHILLLRPKWDKKIQQMSQEEDNFDDDDIYVCQAIASLFAETAETYIDFMISDVDIGQVDILQQLVECARFPYDLAVSRIPLKFFYDLNTLLKSPRIKSNSSLSVALVQKFSPVFGALMTIAVQQLVLPSKIFLGLENLDEEWDDRRSEWQDAAADCFDVLDSSECLTQLFSSLHSALNPIAPGAREISISWNLVESILLCISLLSEKIPSSENVLIPQLISMLHLFPIDIVLMRIAVVNLTGMMSRWLCSNPAELPVLLNILVSSLKVEVTCVPSARAIMRLLISSSNRITLPIEGLHQVILELRNSNLLPLEADLFLIEGMCQIVSDLPPESHSQSVGYILEPIAASLAALVSDLQTAPSSLGVGLGEVQLVAHLDRLTAVVRYSRVSGSIILEFFLRLLPLCQKVLDANSSERICEKTCRLYKHSIRGCKNHFNPHLHSMTTYLSNQFHQRSEAAFLYVCSVCISDFASRDQGGNIDVLYHMIWAVSTSLFSKYNTVDHFIEHPDVIAEYFYMISKALLICPAPFSVAQAEASVIVQAGITALQLRHREAQKCVLLFFERLFGVNASPNLLQIIESTGGALIQGLFEQLSGQYRAYAIDEADGCICDVIWCIKKKYPNQYIVWTNTALQMLPESSRSVAVAIRLPQGLLDLSSEKSTLCRLVDEFERNCHRMS